MSGRFLLSELITEDEVKRLQHTGHPIVVGGSDFVIGRDRVAARENGALLHLERRL